MATSIWLNPTEEMINVAFSGATMVKLPFASAVFTTLDPFTLMVAEGTGSPLEPVTFPVIFTS